MKMHKLRKIYKCTFSEVYTFFVGTADENCIKAFTLFVGVPEKFDEKWGIKYFHTFFFLSWMKNV